MKTQFPKAITVDDVRCDIEHVRCDDFCSLPQGKIVKVHAVCLHDGKMLIVNHPEWGIWGIPGGTCENGENALTTLMREIVEETNCEAQDAQALAYQKVYHHDEGVEEYRLFYICNVQPLGEFEGDPAGNVAKIKWVQPQEAAEYIESNPFRQAVIADALSQMGALEEI